MKTADIKEIQRRIGTTVDGFWGPKSEARVREYLSAMHVKRFPTRSQIASERSIFGKHGSRDYSPPMTKIALPFDIRYEGSIVRTLRVHEKCADAMLSAMQRIADVYPTSEARDRSGITTFDGLYNPRLMRGSSTSWSMHAWAIAIDFDAGRNGLHMHWPKAASMPLDVIECFTREGFWSLGGMEARDAMHFEASSGK